MIRTRTVFVIRVTDSIPNDETVSWMSKCLPARLSPNALCRKPNPMFTEFCDSVGCAVPSSSENPTPGAALAHLIHTRENGSH